MKIAIGPMFSDYGGVSAHIKGIQKHSSYDVEFVPKRHEKRLIEYFSRININQSNMREFYMNFKGRFNLANYDVLHSHADPTFTEICNDYKGPKTKWVHTYHTMYFPEDSGGVLESWEKRVNDVLIKIAPKADEKICVSNWFHDILETEYSIDSIVIPNGVDVDSCLNSNPEGFQSTYGLNNFILFVGNIDNVKNPVQFIHLAGYFTSETFVMVGRDLTPEKMIEQYKVKIPKNVKLLGELNRQDTLNAMAACKTLVVTSRREGLPTVPLEAMALAKPVVVSDAPGCVEVVGSKEYGFIYDSNSLEDLVENTSRAMESKHVCENARKRVLETFDWKVLAKKIDKIYSVEKF